MNLRGTNLYAFGVFLTVALFLTTAEYFWGVHQLPGAVIEVIKTQVTTLNNGIRGSFQNEEENSDNPVEITIVTMYINIGKFQKGDGNYFYTPSDYKNWFTSWGWLTNRVIAFIERDEDLNNFRQIRSSQPADRTVLIKINRTELSAFQHLEKIRQIFQSPNYPKHPPNTVVPEYSCTMHAKYDVLQMALRRGLVHTKHMAWLDIGLFRHLPEPNFRPKNDTFTLEVPYNFNSSCVSMSEVTPRKDIEKYSPRDFIWNNIVWVGGAFNLGTRENFWKFADSYRHVFEDLLRQNLTSTDQQIIASMYSPAYKKLQMVDMRPYPCNDGEFGLHGSDCQYFYLGFLCKDAAEKRRTMI